jgi:hypothetical protein
MKRVLHSSEAHLFDRLDVDNVSVIGVAEDSLELRRIDSHGKHEPAKKFGAKSGYPLGRSATLGSGDPVGCKD